MASHHQNQLVARCIVGLADSARYADNRLAAACFAVVLAVSVAAVALAVAAGFAEWLVAAGPILLAIAAVEPADHLASR